MLFIVVYYRLVYVLLCSHHKSHCASFSVFHCYFFFFKQKTAYEMRISDWSSDVCSSDLPSRTLGLSRRRRAGVAAVAGWRVALEPAPGNAGVTRHGAGEKRPDRTPTRAATA